jgi:hypothetical protein
MISARYLLAEPPPALTTIPAGFKITQCPTKVLAGARRPRKGKGSGGAAEPTGAVAERGERRALLAYAHNATMNKR